MKNQQKAKSKAENIEKKRRTQTIAAVVGIFLLIALVSPEPASEQNPAPTSSPSQEATSTATPEEKPTGPTPNPAPDKDNLADTCARALFIKGYKVASLVYALDHNIELFDGLGYYTKDKKEVYHVRGPIKTPSGEDSLYSCYITADADIMLLRVDGKEIGGGWSLLYDSDGGPILDD